MLEAETNANSYLHNSNPAIYLGVPLAMTQDLLIPTVGLVLILAIMVLALHIVAHAIN